MKKMKKIIISIFALFFVLSISNINACETCGCKENNQEVKTEKECPFTTNAEGKLVCEKTGKVCDGDKKACCKTKAKKRSCSKAKKCCKGKSKKSSCSKSKNGDFNYNKSNNYGNNSGSKCNTKKVKKCGESCTKPCCAPPPPAEEETETEETPSEE